MIKKALLLVPFVLLAGCGSGGLKTYPVTGTVKNSGAPLEGVGVSLVAVDGKGVAIRGIADASGAFSCVSVGGQAGAPAGDYKVILLPPVLDDSYMSPGAKPAKELKLPEKYTVAAKAEIFTVKEGPNQLDIDIAK